MRAAGPSEERDLKSGPAISVGDVLLGKYRVERLLGEGSMGTILAARHTDSGELFALKVLTAKALASSQAVERFLREARALARLRGPHVAAVHEILRLPSGAPCMVMEHLSGSDLQEILKSRGKISPREAIEWLLQACEGVAAAHALDIIHRDIKPANLFVSVLPDGRSQVRVLDFGIAKLVERDTPFDHELTTAGMVFGTPSYMSPEQMRQTKDVDGRTDIWALGVVLYEMLTGALPFVSTPGSTDLVVRVSLDPPRRPIELCPDLPPALDAIVMRCLEKKPDRRYSTVPELIEALRAVLATLPNERGSLAPAPPAGDRMSPDPIPVSARGAPPAPVSVRGIPPAPGSMRGVPPAPVSVRGAPPASIRETTPLSGRGTPPPMSRPSAAGEGSPESGRAGARRIPKWAMALAALFVLGLVAAVPAVLLSDRGPSSAGSAEAPTAPCAVSTQPVIQASAPSGPTTKGAPPEPATASAVEAPSAAPKASAPASPRPSPSSTRPKPKSFNACFSDGDCRRGKKCVRGWCK